MSPRHPQVDRPAAIRRALVELVAERGFHGTSVAAVAARACVAAGTVYVHYPSKDDLVVATFAELKGDLGAAAVDGLDPSRPPAERFARMWRQVYAHLAADPARARFLAQVETSPYARSVPHGSEASSDARAAEPGALEQAAAAPDFAPLLTELPPRVLYDLAFGPAVRLAASADTDLSRDALDRLVEACWRAITTGEAAA